MILFDNLLSEYKRLYTEWCRFGMPGGIIKWCQGRGGAGYNSYPKDVVDIHQCCEDGKYVDTSKPWLYYDKANDSIIIYSVHGKIHTEILLFDVRRSILPRQEMLNYARQHSLKLDILLGKFLHKRSRSKNTEVVVLSGKHADFVKAGWEDVFQAESRQKEQEAAEYRQGCKDTAARIKASLPTIEQAYYSAAMKAMEEYKCGHGNDTVFLSDKWCYTLHLSGVRWNNLLSSTTYNPACDYSTPFETFDGSWFMPFSQIGFSALQTEEQLFCFAVAMFCRKNGIIPSDLDVEKVAWNCEIKTDYRGTFINNPRVKPVKQEEPPLKAIFSE